MRVAATVVLCVALIAGAWAADEETVTETVAVNEQPAAVVQSLAVALNPDTVVRATIVKHLPSHEDAEEDAAEPLGNAFETSNWEADQVAEEDTLDATAFVEANADADTDAADEDEEEAEDEADEEDAAEDEDMALLEVADEDEAEDETETEEESADEAEEQVDAEAAMVEVDALDAAIDADVDAVFIALAEMEGDADATADADADAVAGAEDEVESDMSESPVFLELDAEDEDEEEEEAKDEDEDEADDEAEEEADEEEEEAVALVEADADAETSAPSFGPNAKAVKAAAAAVVPGMTTPPLGKPTNANTDPTKMTAVEKALATPVMDQAAIKATHLYTGYEPTRLPTGTEIKRPVDTSGTIGTEAGTAFNYKKGQTPKSKKCANGCQLRLPVMVGYRGVREDPAEKTRRVTVPGDRERHRRIHRDFKTPKQWLWNKHALKAADKHIRHVAWRLNKLRIKRKAYEDTALNREVNVPDNAAGIATL